MRYNIPSRVDVQKEIEEDIEEAMRRHDDPNYEPVNLMPPEKTPLTLQDVKGKESWEDRAMRMLRPLNDSCRSCSMCELGRKQAHDNHPTTKMYFDPHVFSNMRPSKWVVVGQNPGKNECIKGIPFVGDAGKNFDDEIEENGLSRDKFYITNAVKCFTIKNEKPELLHRNRCEPFLRMELQLLRPTLVITLGAVAFSIFSDLGMSDNLGNVVESKKFGVKVYPVYHPSPRNMSDSSRKDRFRTDIARLCKLIKKYESTT